MKKLTPSFFSITGIYCRIVGHKLRVSKNVTDHICEYRCKNCGMEMTDTAQGLLSKLTPKFKDTNDYLAQIHQRKQRLRSQLKAS